MSRLRPSAWRAEAGPVDEVSVDALARHAQRGALAPVARAPLGSEDAAELVLLSPAGLKADWPRPEVYRKRLTTLATAAALLLDT